MAHVPRRIAFFGGSFDPPHGGHLAIARAALQALQLDEVLFAPVGTQPLKPGGAVAAFTDRLAMVRLAIENEPGFRLSLLDAPVPDAPGVPTPGPRYTIDTLQRLRSQAGAQAELFCLIGADSFSTLARWHRGAEIPFAASLIVAARPGQPVAELAQGLPPGLALEENASPGNGLRCFLLRNTAGRSARLFLLPDLHYDISATRIRRQIQAGNPADLPAAVAAYIAAHQLYR